jgi:arylsulfatase A-like enzyme/HEAT repeat protein
MPWAALLFCVLEAALLVGMRNRDFANLWELQWGITCLLPTLTLQAVLAGLMGATLVAGALAPQPTLRWLALGFAVMLATWLGYELTFGRHFALWWRRVGFIAVLAVSAGGAVFWGGKYLQNLLHERPRLAAWLALTTALLFLAVNRFVLVRLYPAFHVGLGWLSLVSAGIAGLGYVAGRGVTSGDPRRARAIGLGSIVVVTVLAGACLVPASRMLSRFDNFRWVASENAPLLGQAVEFAALIAAPKELAPEGPVSAQAETGPRAQLGLADRDILLITVDALRADHVGAYGYGRPTTPNVDRLAAEGVRFERAYCATPHTSYSVTSLLTGKYMRPLLLQGLGADSETWADLLRRYGYRTAAFYPPAIFFIDTERFADFDQRQLGFEYQKREFLEGEPRAAQVSQYLRSLESDSRAFVWLHLFGPHEPYEVHGEFGFGESDVDRYDSEIRATDETIGKVVAEFRAQRPAGIVIVTADHGEEFGDHGGRYHGSSVYEEQVRVPLVISAPGVAPKVVAQPVQTTDLLPTVLSVLEIPTRPRIRGRDLSPLLTNQPEPAGQAGFAFAETDEQSMLAEGSARLLCLRRVGACQLFDVERDPGQTRDVSRDHPEIFERLRQRLRHLNSEHGQFELAGARAEGLRLPGPILRGLAGDVDAAPEIAALLDDADVGVRRKAAEVLYDLAGPSTAKPEPALTAKNEPPRRQLGADVATPLRLALQRDEDHDVRSFSALALTRLGEGAALTRELLETGDVPWRRRAALALAESGDKRGMTELLGWWMDKTPRPFEVSAQLITAFARGKVTDAVWPLTLALADVRLRPFVVAALGEIGDETAVNSLVAQFKREPYQNNRTLLAQSLLRLGAGPELAVPLRRWLGVGEPLTDGLAVAVQAGVLEQVGGPNTNDLRRLRQNANLGQLIQIVVPKTGNGRGIRLLARVSNAGPSPLTLRVGVPQGVFSFDSQGKLKTSRKIPELDVEKQLTLNVPAGAAMREIHGSIPESMGLRPGRSSYVVVFAEHGVTVEAVAFVPHQDELASAEHVPAE